MEGARPYILAADEAQPIEPLIVGEVGSGANGHAGRCCLGAAAETLMERIPHLPQAMINSQTSAGEQRLPRWAGRASERRTP